MHPEGRHLEEPGTCYGQLFVLPADLVHAGLLQDIPESLTLLIVRALAVKETKQEKAVDIDISSHMITLIFFFLLFLLLAVIFFRFDFECFTCENF